MKTKNRKIISVLMLLFVAGFAAPAHAQKFGLKTNTLYWLGGGNINAGFEAAVARKWTLQLSGSYNPWDYKPNKKMHFLLAEPEVKYWFCERFEGHFIGLVGHGAQFYGGFHKTRYDGYMAGGGLTYGYNWILSNHWNLEAEIGAGYEYLWYKKSPNVPCEKCKQKAHGQYIGPVKAALSFVYLF